MKIVLVYVKTNAEVGDADHVMVFPSEEASEKWFSENDAESVAFEYDLIE
jgi:hypothetical protein